MLQAIVAATGGSEGESGGDGTEAPVAIGTDSPEPH